MQQLPVVASPQGNTAHDSHELTRFPACPPGPSKHATSDTSSSSSGRELSPVSNPVANSTSAASSQTSSQPAMTTERFVGFYHAVREFAHKIFIFIRVTAGVFTFIITVIVVWPAFLGALESRKATEIAQWTSKKDFLERCESHNWEPLGCREEKGTELGPPPTAVRRQWDRCPGHEESYNDHVMSPLILPDVFYLYIAPLAPVYLAYALLTPTCRRLAWHYLVHLCRGPAKLLRHAALLLQRPAYGNDNSLTRDQGSNDCSSPDLYRQEPESQQLEQRLMKHILDTVNCIRINEDKVGQQDIDLEAQLLGMGLQEQLRETSIREHREASLEELQERGLQESSHRLKSSNEGIDMIIIPERHTTSQNGDYKEGSKFVQTNVGSGLRRRDRHVHVWYCVSAKKLSYLA
ncbi:hypothetical protein F5X99DRAFT_382756 [Biscogniauxia marginata]|nr:hypothetical protein F5X99DRAFT_382756 [Biscogniauxia marginata]